MIKIHLSKLLGERRMKQLELSRLTGVNKNIICDLYNEFTDRVSLDTLDRICEALQCDLSDLLEYIPNSTPRTGENLIVDKRQSEK